MAFMYTRVFIPTAANPEDYKSAGKVGFRIRVGSWDKRSEVSIEIWWVFETCLQGCLTTFLQ